MLGVNHSNRSNHDYLLWKIENHDLAKLRLNAIPASDQESVPGCQEENTAEEGSPEDEKG